MINRRNFIASIGSAAAVGYNAMKELRPNWRCIVGGLRTGKSTRAAEIVKQHKLLFVLGRDLLHCLELVRRSAFTATDLHEIRFHLERDSIPKEKSALWINEAVPNDIDVVADLFDCIVVSSRPSKELFATDFFKACASMGTVEYMSVNGVI